MTLQLILMLVCIGLVAGVLSGLIGIGGGIIMVPLLLLLGLSQQQAQGTSLAAMLPPVTLLAVISYHKEGMVNWKHALIISAVFIIGGFFGSKVALHIDQKALRKIFAIVLLIVAGKLFFTK